MAIIDINWNPPRRHLRWFAVLQIAFFALVAAGIYRRTGNLNVAAIVVAVSAVVGLMGLLYPPLIRAVYVVWMAVVFPIGWIVSHLLMLVIFYLVFTPVGFIMRLCGRDPMQRKFDPDANTYWVPRQSAEDKRRYFKQY